MRAVCDARGLWCARLSISRVKKLAGGALERLERIIRHAMELPYLLAALLRTSILLCAMALAKAGLRVAEKTAAVVAWVLSPPDRV